MSKSRLALAFLCAGVTVVVGIMASSMFQALIHRDDGFLAAAWLVPFFGLPFILAALLAACAVFGVARAVGRVTKPVAVGTGVLFGAVVALVTRIPMLPLWAACLVGAAAGWVWWQVLVDGASPRAT